SQLRPDRRRHLTAATMLLMLQVPFQTLLERRSRRHAVGAVPLGIQLRNHGFANSARYGSLRPALPTSIPAQLDRPALRASFTPAMSSPPAPRTRGGLAERSAGGATDRRPRTQP